MIQGFQQQKEDARLRSIAPRKRYEEHFRAMEAAFSEIYASERFESMLNSQISLVQHDLNRLYGLIHPIRRCPSDILRYIFEWVVEMDKLAWQTTAARLSHVCRRWRSIALESPYLWKRIQIGACCKPDQVRALWTHATERMKNTAAQVTIVNIIGNASESKVFEQCRFDLLPHLKRLELQLESVNAAACFVNAKLSIPTGPIDRLRIIRSYNDSKIPQFPVDVTSIVALFPTARALTMFNFSPASFNVNTVAPNIVELEVGDISNLSLRSLLQAFPSVETVQFASVKFVEEDSGDIPWPGLQSLAVSECINMPFNSLKTPNIRKFLSTDVPGEPIVNFISSHSSLKHVELGYSKTFMSSALQGTHNLVSFTTDVDMTLGDPPHPKLGSLEILGLYQLKRNDISLDLFEKIARNYCIPNNVDEGDTQRHVALQIIVPNTVLVEELEWRASELLSSAIEQCSNSFRWNAEFTIYNLRWA